MTIQTRNYLSFYTFTIQIMEVTVSQKIVEYVPNMDTLRLKKNSRLYDLLRCQSVKLKFCPETQVSSILQI